MRISNLMTSLTNFCNTCFADQNKVDSGMDVSQENLESVEDDTESIEEKTKKKTPGIIYLSTIPPFMTVKKVREIFSKYGTLDHIFLQPNTKGQQKAQKRFTEGWVEFVKKRDAKFVATFLNNKQVGGKRRSKWHDCLWNIKYLHRFKWVHLNERLAYEKATHDQRMRVEIAQAKRETNFYINAVEKNKIIRRIQKRNGNQEETIQEPQITDETHKKKDKTKEKKDLEIDQQLLSSVVGNFQ